MNKKTGKYLQCDECKKEIYVSKYKLEYNKHFFCSQDCRYKFLTGKQRASLSEEVKKKISNSLKGYKHTDEMKSKISAIHKGKPSYKRTSKTIDKLKNTIKKNGGHKGEKNPRWRGGISKIKATCDHCGKEHLFRTCNFKNYNFHFCSNNCRGLWLSENITGEKAPGWMGGKSFEPYSKEFNKKLKELIRTRDNYNCQICSKKQGKIPLPVHHIDYNKLNSNLDNLITLCNKCHGKTNFNRDDWEYKLKILIRNKYVNN